MIDNLYLPQQAIIEKIIPENDLVKTFVLALSDPLANYDFRFEPGQFIMVSAPHQGEAPISFSSSPLIEQTFSLTIRKSGRLTQALHALQPGDTIGVRGPYGRPFPMDQLSNKKILFIAGGIGIAPLRPLLELCREQKKGFGTGSALVYGCKTPDEICFKEDLKLWQQSGINCLLTVDQGGPDWDGSTGLVTALLTRQLIVNFDFFIICGPGIMIRFVIEQLEELGARRDQIITTLERHMKCGVGICGHCHLDGKLVCKDGPVYQGPELPELTRL